MGISPCEVWETIEQTTELDIFLQTFLLYNWILQKKRFANVQFFADSRSRAKELSNDGSFVIFGHQTWDLEGGSKLKIYTIRFQRYKDWKI